MNLKTIFIYTQPFKKLLYKVIPRRLIFLLALITFILSASPLHAERVFSIVSDLDDTLKINHGTSLPGQIGRSLFSKEAYSGVSSLIHQLERAGRLDEYPNSKYWHLVSASPAFLESWVHRFISYNRFPAPWITLRPSLFQPVFDFKFNAIREILLNYPEPVILLGDDIDQDPVIYEEIAKAFPERILSVYVHWIRGKTDRPANQYSFLTPFEVAEREFQQGRLNLENTLTIGLDTLAGEDHLLFPDFLTCPDESELESRQSSNPYLMETSEKILNRIQSICAHRSLTQK